MCDDRAGARVCDCMAGRGGQQLTGYLAGRVERVYHQRVSIAAVARKRCVRQHIMVFIGIIQ